MAAEVKISSAPGIAQYPSNSFYARCGKRLFDVTMGTVLAVVTLPIQAVLALLVRRKLGRPVLFRQVRPGLDSQPFEIVKFRTMNDARGSDGQSLPDADRLPPFGEFLRSTSLDELPELYNVIKGDMSLVGPRPLLTKYLDLYSPQEAIRHAVRPGITGWSQVNGRNNQTWQKKLQLDVDYVGRISLGLDLRILFQTAIKVVRRIDIHADGHVTAPEFTGNAPHNVPRANPDRTDIRPGSF